MSSCAETGIKKSPKNCRLCRQHNVLVIRKRHKCLFEKCQCNKCSVIRLQRQIMSQQIKLRRVIDKERSDQNKTNPCSSYLCQRCKNHGINISKRNHDECQFSECTCERCALVQARACIEQEINRTCIRNPNSLVKEVEDKISNIPLQHTYLSGQNLNNVDAETLPTLNLPFQQMQYKTNTDFTAIFQQPTQLQNNFLTNSVRFPFSEQLALCLQVNQPTPSSSLVFKLMQNESGLQNQSTSSIFCAQPCYSTNSGSKTDIPLMPFVFNTSPTNSPIINNLFGSIFTVNTVVSSNNESIN